MSVSSARTARRPLVDELRTVAGMRKSGLLTDDEFVALGATIWQAYGQEMLELLLLFDRRTVPSARCVRPRSFFDIA